MTLRQTVSLSSCAWMIAPVMPKSLTSSATPDDRSDHRDETEIRGGEQSREDHRRAICSRARPHSPPMRHGDAAWPAARDWRARSSPRPSVSSRPDSSRSGARSVGARSRGCAPALYTALYTANPTQSSGCRARFTRALGAGCRSRRRQLGVLSRELPVAGGDPDSAPAQRRSDPGARTAKVRSAGVSRSWSANRRCTNRSSAITSGNSPKRLRPSGESM